MSEQECRFCGQPSKRAYHESDGDCISALQAEIARLRAALDAKDEHNADCQCDPDSGSGLDWTHHTVCSLRKEAKDRDQRIANLIWSHALKLSASVAAFKEDAMGGLRCVITHNPCGTDTRMVGCPCECGACQRWEWLRALPASREALDRMLAEARAEGGWIKLSLDDASLAAVEKMKAAARREGAEQALRWAWDELNPTFVVRPAPTHWVAGGLAALGLGDAA